MSSRLATLAKALLVGALAVLLIAKFNVREIAGYLTADKLRAVLIIQPIVLFGFGLAAVRLAILMGVRPMPVSASFKALMLCYGVNVVLPGRVSELLKVTYMRDHAGVKLAEGLSAVFLERITDLLMLGVLASAAAALYVTGVNTAAMFMAAAAVALLLGFPLIAPMGQRLVTRIPSVRLRSFFQQFIEYSVARMTHRAYFGVLGLSVLMWLLSLSGMVVFFTMAGGNPIGISGALVVFAASTLGAAVPVLPGGFGTYEAAVVFVLRGYGYDLNEALAVALALHGSQIILACVSAPIIALRERTGVSTLISDALETVRQRK